MITEAHGNLLKADVDALVNTVNTVGVMGKGIALQFKRAYPDMFEAYAKAAKAGQLALGNMHVWETGQLTGPRYVINFPTKQHWRNASRLEDVEVGLEDLVRVIEDLGIRSIAVPPLGCGHGGLHWREVEPVIRRALDAVPDVEVRLYLPAGAPDARDRVTGGATPRMTPGRAALIALMSSYVAVAFEWPSLIASQKLMYFLQTAGEPLKLHFEKHHYGPYADNLRHVLREMEGHYIVGFGDGSQSVQLAEPLELRPGAVDDSRPILDANPETEQRIERVISLISGFESPYGLELLASVLWTTHEDQGAASDPDRAIAAVHSWSPRKERMFTEEHIRIAWEALRDRGWLEPALVSA